MIEFDESSSVGTFVSCMILLWLVLCLHATWRYDKCYTKLHLCSHALSSVHFEAARAVDSVLDFRKLLLGFICTFVLFQKVFWLFDIFIVSLCDFELYILLGVILRDSHGVAQVRFVTGNKILRILKAKGLAPDLPEDLYSLIKKAVNIRKHLERSRKVCNLCCTLFLGIN